MSYSARGDFIIVDEKGVEVGYWGPWSSNPRQLFSTTGDWHTGMPENIPILQVPFDVGLEWWKTQSGQVELVEVAEQEWETNWREVQKERQKEPKWWEKRSEEQRARPKETPWWEQEKKPPVSRETDGPER